MSPVVQLAFGSFGDIVALLQLIAELCTALHAARDSSDDIRALVDDLMAFSCAIDEVKIALEGRHTALRPGLLTGITNAVSLCHTMLRDVQRRIDKFNQLRIRSLGPVAWGKYLSSVSWAICGEKRVVATLKQRMWEQLGLVHTMLAIAHINDQDGLVSAMNSQKASLLQLHRSMREMRYLSHDCSPCDFFSTDVSLFKAILQFTTEVARTLLNYRTRAKEPKISSYFNNNFVYYRKIEGSVGPMPVEGELRWISHRSDTAEEFVFFLDLPRIHRGPKEVWALIQRVRGAENRKVEIRFWTHFDLHFAI